MFVEFFIENWILFLALACVLVLLVFDPAGVGTMGMKKLSPMELSRLVNHEQAVIIDTRSSEEYKNGHITKSRNIFVDDIQAKSAQLEKYRNRPIVLVCNNGQQSAKASKILKKLNFDKLFILNNGLTEWRKDDLPLEKSKSVKSTRNKKAKQRARG